MATAAYSQTRTVTPGTGFSRPLPGMARPYPQQPILIGPGGVNGQFIPGLNNGFVGTQPGFVSTQPGFVGARPGFGGQPGFGGAYPQQPMLGTNPGFVGTQPGFVGTQPGFVGTNPYLSPQAAQRGRMAVRGGDPTGRSGLWGNPPVDPATGSGVVFVPGRGYVAAGNSNVQHLLPQQTNGAANAGASGNFNGTQNGAAGAFNGGVNGTANGTLNGNANAGIVQRSGVFTTRGGSGGGYRAARVINNRSGNFGTNVNGVRGNNFRSTRPSVAQARVVERAQNLMQDQPFREGQVVDLDGNTVTLRYSLNGDARTERVPLSQVFYFGSNGQLSTASTSPGTLQLGTRVMFPARR